MEDGIKRRVVAAEVEGAPPRQASVGPIARIEAPRWVRLALGLLAILLGLEIAHDLLGLPGGAELYDVWFATIIISGSAALCVARARRQPVDREAWIAIAAGMLSWSAGTILWEVQYAGLTRPPYPSDADVLWLLWYPFTAVGLGLLIRARVARFDLQRWMDGLVVMLLVLAAAFPLTLHPVVQYFGDYKLAGLVDISYPLLDTLLLGGILGTFGLIAWRPDRAWILIAVGCVMMTAGDAAFAVQQARGVADHEHYGFVWSAGALMIASAAWVSGVRRHEHRELHGWAAIALPLFAALLAVALQLGIVLFPSFDTQTHRVTVLVVLVIATIQLVLSRPRSAGSSRHEGETSRKLQRTGADSEGRGP
jgi:diguanylate cyclase